MNRDYFESQWSQIREYLREKWSNLTDEDLRQINGRYDQLISKLQQRYGYSREEAEEELRRWNIDRAARQEKSYAHLKDERRNESSSLFKWLLLAGIPLLLLAGWLAHENTKTADTTYRTDTTQDITPDTATRDQLITQNIQRALAANDLVAPDIQNIRIQTSNGIVTISGVVGTNQERDMIFRIVQGISGVRQMNNQLEVR